MGLGPKLQGRLGQQQALLPGVQLGLQVLRAPLAQLDQQLRDAAETNPFLIYHPPAAGFGGVNQAAIAASPTIADHLREQLVLMGLPSHIRQLTEALAGDLNEDGYLTSSDAELASALDTSLPDIRRAIDTLQSCEPTGIGARNLEECLSLQLIARGTDPEFARTVSANLERLVEGRWTKLRHRLNMDDQQLQALAELIRNLSPNPAAYVGQIDTVPAPELRVYSDGQGGFRVELQGDELPSLTLDQDLMKTVDRSHPQMGPLRAAAEAMARALTFRNHTLTRVAATIVAHQNPFFSGGEAQMRPLTRKSLADVLDLHPSTIGRCVADKALSFRGQVYPLSAFLTAAIGTSHSAFAVQRRIRHLIASETGEAPLSDAKIAALLHSEGVDIARRTVAKYRGCMSIPSSHERMRRSALRRNRFS